MYYGYGYGFNHKGDGVIPFDADAQAFITAASITDPTQQSAVNQLVVDLKAASIWTKMNKIFPFVGGTAGTNAYCLKTATASTFFGGVTHASTGSTFNGSNGYLDTLFAPSSLTNNSTHLSVYVRTNTDGVKADIGASALAGPFLPMVGMRVRDANLFYNFGYEYTPVLFSTANTDSRGFFIANRTSSTVLNSWKNGSKLATNTTANTRDVTNITQNVFVGGLNLGGSMGQASDREYAFATIGAGLSDADAAAFTTAVQTFQTTLSRNV